MTSTHVTNNDKNTNLINFFQFSTKSSIFYNFHWCLTPVAVLSFKAFYWHARNNWTMEQTILCTKSLVGCCANTEKWFSFLPQKIEIVCWICCNVLLFLFYNQNIPQTVFTSRRNPQIQKLRLLFNFLIFTLQRQHVPRVMSKGATWRNINMSVNVIKPHICVWWGHKKRNKKATEAEGVVRRLFEYIESSGRWSKGRRWICLEQRVKFRNHYKQTFMT